LYEVNFTTKPNQTLAAGANVIDGKTWWLKGSIGTDIFDVNAGLRIQSRENTSIYHYSTGAFTRGALYFPYSQLAGYDSTKQTITQAWWQTYSLAYPGNAAGYISLFSCAASSAAITNAERTGLNVALYDQNAPTAAWRYLTSYAGHANGGLYVNTTHIFSPPANREVISIVDVQAGRVQFAALDQVATPGLWPPTALSSVGLIPDSIPLGASASPSSGLAVWVENHLGTPFGLQTFVLGGIRVLQN
jgi:hypothetical protein